MKIVKLLPLAVAAVLATGAAGSAVAADLNTGDIIEDNPPFVPAFSPWYVALRAGAAIKDDVEFTDGVDTVTSSFDTGFFGAAALGYSFARAGTPGLRLEAEFSYLTNGVNELTLNNVLSTDANADVTTFAGLASAYYDLPLSTVIRPFVGAGIGYANTSFNGTSATIDASDSGFAWHLTAGADFQLAQNTDLELGYRFFRVEGLQFDNAIDQVADQNHIIFAGLRYHF